MAVVINGSAGVTTNSGAVYNGLQTGTAVTASGTSVDFTSIPSWVKRITVMFSGVSGSGTSPFQIQLGDSGGFETTGYASGAGAIGTASAAGGASTTGLLLQQAGVAAATSSGLATITNVSGNTWVFASTFGTPSNGGNFGGGTKTLSDVLTQIRITTVNGTDTFDAGTINIIYE